MPEPPESQHETTCRYCFRPATALLRDMPLCATHMAKFVRLVGGPTELAGLSRAPVQRAADKHFRDGGVRPDLDPPADA